MPTCPSETDYVKATMENPMGMGPDTAAMKSDTPGSDADPLQQTRDAAERSRVLNDLADVAQDADFTGQQATASDQRNARITAARLVRFVEDARAGVARRMERWHEALNVAAGTSVGRASAWLNLQNKVYTTFVNERGDFAKWARMFADQPDRTTAENTLWREYDQMPSKIRALNNIYRDRIATAVKSIVPVAKRIGWEPERLAEILGHYAVCKHTPEVNRLLLERWGQRVDELLPDGATDVDAADLLEAQRLMDQIDALEANLDSLEPDEDLVSAGYTDAEAAKYMEDIITHTGVTREEADGFAQSLSGLYDMLLQERINAGVVSPEVLESFPAFENYVAIRTRDNNLSGATNDSRPYNPGSYQAIQGRKQRPDSAYATLKFYANRAATEVGMQEFALQMFALERQMRLDGRFGDSGLKSYSYNTLVKMQHGIDPTRRRIADHLLEGGGIVADVPVEQPDGSRTLERRYLHFDPNWIDEASGLSGESLNKGLSSNYKLGDAGKVIEALATGTSYFSQMSTRFTAGFAPVSGIRDVMERSFNMLNRDYFDEAGNRISGGRMGAAMIGNTARAGKVILDFINGKLSPDSQMYKYIDEYRRNGLYQRYTQGVKTTGESVNDMLQPGSTTRIEKMLGEQGGQAMQRWLNGLGTAKQQTMRVLDGWNDYFQNLGSFAQFITLREAGVPPSRAARGVLEMMNLSHRGTLTPYMRVLFPFVVPTVESGVAFARTMGLNARTPKEIFKQGKRGYLSLLGAYAAYSLLYPLARESMGQDENGTYIMDTMSLSDLTRGLPIGLNRNGDYVRLPIGFGMPQIAALLAVGTDRVENGLLDPQDLAFETLFTTVKNTMPGNWPAYKFTEHPSSYLAAFITPAPLRPLMDVAINRSYFGQEITRARPDSTTAMADTGRTGTPVLWHDLAKTMNQTYGIDLAPEQWRYMAKSIMLGPLRTVMALTEADSLHKGSQDPSVLKDMHPLLAGLGASTWLGNAGNTSQIMYYNAKDDYERRIRQSGVKITDTSYGNDAVAAEAFKRAKLKEAGFTPEEIDDYILIWRTDKQMREVGKKFNKDYKERWLAMDTSQEMRDAFAALANQSRDLYGGVVQNLNYYAGGAR